LLPRIEAIVTEYKISHLTLLAWEPSDIHTCPCSIVTNLGIIYCEWLWSGGRGPSATGRHGAGAPTIHTHTQQELTPQLHTPISITQNYLLSSKTDY
jgi:hypothetical protein